ncbi:MAG: hypothetical protein MSIBF_04665 [Candidatus Altiarchaeales archaeon IMC4]|nr:MAG: hypothetical protein MSIBF_04665 [Candidatus Altiarchaeales archaeon IMC4]
MINKKKRPYAVIGLAAFGLLFYMLLPFIDVILLGVFVYYVTRPVYRSFVRVIKSETASAVIALLFLILPLILFFAYLVSMASAELNNALLSAFPTGGETNSTMGAAVSGILAQLSESSKTLTYEEAVSLLKDNKGAAWAALGAVSASLMLLFRVFIALTIAYYLLKDGHKLRSWAITSLFKDDQKLAERFFKNVDSNFHSLFIGNMLSAVITAVVGCVVFLAIDHYLLPPELSIGKYALVLGVLCGMANLIPGIGMKLIWVPLAAHFVFKAYLLGVLFGIWWVILLSIAIVVVFVDWIPDLLLRPYIAGRGIHTGLILLSYIFGPLVFGFVGLLLGPMIMVVAINLGRILPEIREG